MSGIVDVIMWAGENNYSVSEFINEARKMGVSKRIPRNSIPEGIVPGRSRLLIKHKKAIVKTELESDYPLLIDNLIVNDYPVSEGSMLSVVMALENLYKEDIEFWREFIYVYGITWHPGVIGYSYITGLQYVVEEEEEDLPEDLAHIKYLEPIKMEYDDGGIKS
ncbi:hypothetical protein LCGC14_2247890 [marine sediment metagenome]|uniref:Uncharacterized protein n=1 Tax=marine sediment metagenome TaxID=412755 RepID=A0A0F9D3Q2_9ZZZZ|nr:hypothetical protein [bacterium]